MQQKYDKYTFFFTASSPFSNWHPADFKTEDGVAYLCSEQYMMAEKARIFKDTDIRDQILKTTSPSKHRSLGRKVSGFNSDIWNDVSRDVVYKACYYKFT